MVDNGILVGKNLGVLENNLSPMKQIGKAVEILKPLVENKKILGVVAGNHCLRSEQTTGTNPMYLICSELGTQDLYRRNLAILGIEIITRV